MFEHIKYVDMLQKALYKNPTAMNSYDVLTMATINGAKALGLEKEIGSLEENKKADIIILDLNNIEIFPTVDIISEIVHGLSVNNIDTTIINGEVLIKNRKLLLDVDEKELKEKINKISNRLNM